MKPTEPELIPTTASKWLVRIVQKSFFNKKANASEFTVSAELVYGQQQSIRAKNDVVRLEITGEAFHVLSGPTAAKSVRALADQYNREGKLPPERITAKARVDGFHNMPKSDVGGDLLTPMMLR